MINSPNYKANKKSATTYICMHLNEENVNQFVGSEINTYDPKALWDSIINHYATKSLENAASICDRL
jgi:hypothetical protein